MNKLDQPSNKTFHYTEALSNMVHRLKSTNDSRKKYEYVLWLAKKLPSLPDELIDEKIKVKGCISQVYVLGTLERGRVKWQGQSDALITKGLLALLILGLDNLTPREICKIDPSFIEETGLNTSLTPSRANGFLNILLHMKSQVEVLKEISN
tara:strand:- start:369 stop:824 length:456 start_codon:yes stop_codon:yes gene_type:complete